MLGDKEKKTTEKTGSYSTGSSRMNRTSIKQDIKRPNFSRGQKRLAGLIAAIFITALLAGWLGALLFDHTHGLANATTTQKQQFISNESDLIASIAKTVGQSVVSVDVESQSTTQDFFGFPQQSSQQSSGTGFIISRDGIIVTNRHVVPDGTTSVSVTLADGTKYDNVKVIGRTSDSSTQDVAFLQIEDLKGKTLVPATLGDSSKMQVGDKVIAIGNALGQFQNTVTSGIISGYGRDLEAGDSSGTSSESLTDLFQTDAAINEGNSGGPLVNINGEVIGLNTAVASNAQNIGFSIPINDVKGLITSVLGSGKLEQPYLGVRYISLTPDVAYRYNLSVDKGAYVAPTDDGTASIVAGSPAEKAGLREKDIITKINNVTIDQKTSLTAAISKFKVGDHVTLTLIRDGKTLHIKATIGAAPQS
jgi:serine protease Do